MAHSVSKQSVLSSGVGPVDYIQCVEHRRGVISAEVQLPPSYSCDTVPVAQKKPKLFVSHSNRGGGGKTTGRFGLVQSTSNKHAIELYWTHSNRIAASVNIPLQYIMIAHECVLFLFRSPPLRPSFFYSVLQSWWNPLHRALPRLHQHRSPPQCWGFMAVAYQRWVFDIASAEQSHIIQFVAKKKE